MTGTERTTSLNVGIVLAREATDHPWQDFRWRPAEILIGQTNLKTGDVISETAGQTHFFGGTFSIELHHKETPAYVVNLENEPPVVYVVLRDAEEGEPEDVLAMRVETVTVSPFEAQDFLDSGEDIVEPLAMSPPLIAWINGFVERHHQEETFVKRRRDKLDIHVEKFGQQSLAEIRQRQRRH